MTCLKLKVKFTRMGKLPCQKKYNDVVVFAISFRKEGSQIDNSCKITEVMVVATVRFSLFF